MMSAVTLGWLLLTPQTTPTQTHTHGSPCKPEVQLLKNEKTNRIWFFFFTSLNSCLANFSLSLLISISVSPPLVLPPSVGSAPARGGSFGRSSLSAAPPSSQTQNLDPRRQKQSQLSPYPNTRVPPNTRQNTRLTFKRDKNAPQSRFSSAYLLLHKLGEQQKQHD